MHRAGRARTSAAAGRQVERLHALRGDDRLDPFGDNIFGAMFIEIDDGQGSSASAAMAATTAPLRAATNRDRSTR